MRLRNPQRLLLWSGGAVLLLTILNIPRPIRGDGPSLVGPQAWVTAPASHLFSLQTSRAALEPRISVLATDVWSHSLMDGDLRPVPAIPLYRSRWTSFWETVLHRPPEQ